ncbi:MAG: M56 family metallopeptidase [Lachnospirales bacterium]
MNGFESIHIIKVLLTIWLVVSVVKIRDFIIEYKNVHKNIIKLSKPCESKELEILDTIKIELNKYININVYKSSYISTPIGIGLFDKSIVLMDKPNKVEYLSVIVSTLKSPKGNQK